MLEVIDLECIRGDRKLFSGLTFRLNPGELLHLYGDNGSGKTTLMRAICGLIQPIAGAIRWRGEDARGLGEEFTRELLYVGHKNGIKDDLTGVENLRVSSVLDGFPITEQSAWQALEKMGLHGHEDLPVRFLSQGQKRRVALARLLVSETPLWILDEPFTALDALALRSLQAVIRSHLQKDGIVILTTHQEVDLTQGDVKRIRLGVSNNV